MTDSTSPIMTDPFLKCALASFFLERPWSDHVRELVQTVMDGTTLEHLGRLETSYYELNG